MDHCLHFAFSGARDGSHFNPINCCPFRDRNFTQFCKTALIPPSLKCSSPRRTGESYWSPEWIVGISGRSTCVYNVTITQSGTCAFIKVLSSLMVGGPVETNGGNMGFTHLIDPRKRWYNNQRYGVHPRRGWVISLYYYIQTYSPECLDRITVSAMLFEIHERLKTSI